MNSLTVDDLHFELRASAQRRTLQVTIDRGGELVLYVPPDCDSAAVEEFVRERRLWIYKKLAEKEALVRPAATKEYVNGEGFPYLGRSFRLLLVDEQAVPVKLEAGRFKMRRSAAADGRMHMVHWYSVHAQTWLTDRASRLALRVGVNPSKVAVQDLGYRWGSCGRGDKLYFHWRTVLLPPRIVEYVVVHELVHLAESRHSPDFWLRVERAMPDFARRKSWLAVNGHMVAGI
jgi:predicted metal-dependent hydrolase